MIMYNYDMNDILSLVLRSKSGSEQHSAIPRIHDKICNQGQDNFLHILDNEDLQCVTSYLNTKKNKLPTGPSKCTSKKCY